MATVQFTGSRDTTIRKINARKCTLLMCDIITRHIIIIITRYQTLLILKT